MIGVDAGLDLLPRSPQTLVATAVVIGPGQTARPCEYMEHIDCHLGVRFLLVKQATDFQPRQLIEPLQVPPQGLFRRRRCQLALQQLALQIPEERRLVLAQVGFNPVLRVEEHLAVCLPHAVVLQPLPLLLA